MIEILKPGRQQHTKSKKNRYLMDCPFCSCQFTFEDEDVISEKRINGSHYVECPGCKNTIRIFKDWEDYKDVYK